MQTLRSLWITIALVLTVNAAARAGEVTVNCDSKKGSITDALAKLPKEGPNTVRISGTCHENLFIADYDRLTLIGEGGAAINAASDQAPVVFVRRSDHFRLENVTVNASNTFTGIHCTASSVCHVNNVIVQGSGGAGVIFSNSSGFFRGTVQDNQFVGLNVTAARIMLGSGTVIQNNGNRGIVAFAGSVIASSTSIANNGFDGIALETGSDMMANGLNVTGNQGAGIALNDTSSLRINNSSITGNAFPGVFIGHLSLVRFLAGVVTVTGNAAVEGDYDIRCDASTAGAVGVDGPVSGGATTNCTTPAP